MSIQIKWECRSTKSMFANIYNSFIHILFSINCPPSDDWINKLWYIYIMEYHLTMKIKTTDTCSRANEPVKHYHKSKKPCTKGDMLFDSIYMTFLKRKKKLIGTKTIAVVVWAWGPSRGHWLRGERKMWDNRSILFLSCDGGYRVRYTCLKLIEIYNGELHFMWIISQKAWVVKNNEEKHSEEWGLPFSIAESSWRGLRMVHGVPTGCICPPHRAVKSTPWGTKRKRVHNTGSTDIVSKALLKPERIAVFHVSHCFYF